LEKIFHHWNIPCSTVLPENVKNEQFKIALVDCKETKLITQLSHKGPSLIVMGYPSQLHSLASSLAKFTVLKKPIRRSALKCLLARLLSKNLPTSLVREPNPHKDLKHIPILVAEDNPINQKVIKRLLANLGYIHVEVVENGKLAVELLQQKHFDIILMDIMMPEMSGIEATNIIRNKLNLEDLPTIIAVTADVSLENTETLFSLGFDDIVTKPIDKNILQNVLERNSHQCIHS